MTEPHDLNEAGLRDRAVRAAMGENPFDVLIIGGQVVDVVTCRLRQADIGIVGALIASVHPTGQRTDAREIISAHGKIISPGLIDMHMHIESSMVTPSAYSGEVLKRGVTTVVWDPHEYGNSCGLAGVEYALQAADAAQLRIITLAPSCVPSAPGYETTGGDFTPAIIKSLLENPRIHGVAEMMSMQAVLDRDPRMAGIVQAGLDANKRVCGHARGLTGASLNAFVAAGIETDHELTSADDLIEKLEAGLTIEMRGSHDHLLPEFVEALNKLSNFPQSITLCTDDVFVDDLVDNGGLDDVVRRLVRYGLNPFHALQAATLNGASRLGRKDLGLIAPGKRADLVLFDDLKDFKAGLVIINGKSVAEDCRLIRTEVGISIPSKLQNTVSIRKFFADDFRISAVGSSARVATIEKPRFTQWGEREVEVAGGYVVPPNDMITMAIINRFGANHNPKIAFLGEWGSWTGVFATTVSHDSHNINLFGVGEENMAVAANTIADMQGGFVVVSEGKVLAKLPLPIAGLVSEAPTADIANQLREIRDAVDEIADWKPPYRVFKACFGASLVCNAGPHLSDLGLVDTARQIIMESPVITDA